MRTVPIALSLLMASCAADPAVRHASTSHASGSRAARSVETDERGSAAPVDRRCNVLASERIEGASVDAATASSMPAVETLRGRISYYADSLHGNRTASGERYDRHALTAANRTLPFGTLVRIRVTDDPARSVIVRVNDRGPFGRGGRIFDVSRAAAECLGMIRRGVVEARAEVLEYGPSRRGRD